MPLDPKLFPSQMKRGGLNPLAFPSQGKKKVLDPMTFPDQDGLNDSSPTPGLTWSPPRGETMLPAAGDTRVDAPASMQPSAADAMLLASNTTPEERASAKQVFYTSPQKRSDLNILPPGSLDSIPIVGGMIENELNPMSIPENALFGAALDLATPLLRKAPGAIKDFIGESIPSTAAGRLSPEADMLLNQTEKAAAKPITPHSVSAAAAPSSFTPPPVTPAADELLTGAPPPRLGAPMGNVTGPGGDSLTLPGIRPEKFASPEDQATAAKVIAAIPDDALTAAKRGDTMSIQQAKDAALQLGWTKDTVLRLKPGQVMNMEQQKAVEGVFTDELGKLSRLEVAANRAKALPDSPENLAVINSYIQQKIDVVKLGIVRSAQATEAGRSLRALQDQYAAIDPIEAKLAKQLSKATPDVRELVLKQLQSVGDDPQAVVKILQKLDGWSVRAMVAEAATAAKLWAVPTHVVNMTTEAMRVLMNTPIRATAGLIDAIGDPILKRIYGEGRQRWAGEISGDLVGLYDGLKIGINQAVKAAANEGAAMDVAGRSGYVSSIAIKGRPGKSAWIDNFLDAIGPKVRYSFHALGVEDALIRPIAEQSSLRAFTYREVMKEGLEPGSKEFISRQADLLANPTISLIDAAKKEGNISLFQEPLPDVLQKVSSLREVPEFRLIVPFFNIPVNLARQALQFSPVGFVRAGMKASRGEVVDTLAKATIGSMALLPLTMHAMNGGITTEAPKTAVERDRFYSEGKQPYSIRLGDKWYPYARFSPFSEWFSTAGLIAKGAKNASDEDISSRIAEFIFSEAKNLADKTFMKGLSEALDAVMNGDRNAGKFVRNFLTGAILPSISGTAARAIDPVIRKQDDLGDAFKARIPGMSQDLTPVRNRWGEEVVRPGTPTQRFLSPVVPSPVTATPLDDFLDSVGVKLGFPEKSINGRKLNNSEYDFILAKSGQEIKDSVAKAMNDPNFKRLTPENQKQLIDQSISSARLKAREQFVIPSEIRALKIDPATVPQGLYPAIRMLLSTSVYKESKDDKGKRDLMDRVIKLYGGKK